MYIRLAVRLKLKKLTKNYKGESQPLGFQGDRCAKWAGFTIL